MLKLVQRAARVSPKYRTTFKRAAVHYSLKSEPHEILTTLGTKDPKRNEFFEYSWGSWLKNDQSEKKKRKTEFSIEGITKFVKNLETISTDSKNLDKNQIPIVKPPLEVDGSYVLTNNALGGAIKSIASIHEGKHHRIYKISLDSKDLILRIPYKLESDYAIEQKIKSEVATLDFLKLKLNLNVPKVISYGYNSSNLIESPYILMEYLPGDLLMKKWFPMETTPESIESSQSVISTICEFQNKANSIEFNKFGSLYFHDDVPISCQSTLPYEGETNPLLKNRWRIGPSIEQIYSKNKQQLLKQINQYNGPWNKPQDLVKSAIDLEIEYVQTRIGLAQADSSNKVEDLNKLNHNLSILNNYKKVATDLINTESKAMMNVEKLYKPRLFIPDLDPMNVIVNNDVPYFIDFEYTSIKPFILSNYPKFVAYDGIKIYDLEAEIPEFNELDEVEQQEYRFIHQKTKIERLWETELNKINHDFIPVASPHVKTLNAPYFQLLELKNDNDYLYIENSLIRLKNLWEPYVSGGLVSTEDAEFPINYQDYYIEKLASDLQAYQLHVASEPFVATGGWVPQDMFTNLVNSGFLIEDGKGGYKISTEKALDDENKN